MTFVLGVFLCVMYECRGGKSRIVVEFL